MKDVQQFDNVIQLVPKTSLVTFEIGAYNNSKILICDATFNRNT
jgi:hypothetical protein